MSDNDSTSFRTKLPFSQLFIGMTGLLSLAADIIRYGNESGSSDSTAGTLSLYLVLMTLVGYYAWKASRFRYRDAVIIIFLLAVIAESLMITRDIMAKINMLHLALDAMWIVVAVVLFYGRGMPVLSDTDQREVSRR